MFLRLLKALPGRNHTFGFTTGLRAVSRVEPDKLHPNPSSAAFPPLLGNGDSIYLARLCEHDMGARIKNLLRASLHMVRNSVSFSVPIIGCLRAVGVRQLCKD